MITQPPGTGANIEKCLRWARLCGVRVSTVRRSGELELKHTSLGRIRFDAHSRKSAPRTVTVFLKRIWEASMGHNTINPYFEGRVYKDTRAGTPFFNWYKEEWYAFFYNLKAYLLRKRETQRELARDIGVTDSTLSRWISGVKRPSLHGIDCLVEAMKCSVEELFTLDEEKVGCLMDTLEPPEGDGRQRTFFEKPKAKKESPPPPAVTQVVAPPVAELPKEEATPAPESTDDWEKWARLLGERLFRLSHVEDDFEDWFLNTVASLEGASDKRFLLIPKGEHPRTFETPETTWDYLASRCGSVSSRDLELLDQMEVGHTLDLFDTLTVRLSDGD